ncbi:unnamed protein product [Closterium sp. NIES-65]|nr:unnamed protein product [Closterium sp. NIES-65]
MVDHTKAPLPWDLRMRVVCEAATGLAFLHSSPTLIATHFPGMTDHTKPPLPWDLRMRIAYEAATGLAFLHSCRPPIIHRDVKAANVLLDAHMHALVSQRCLAKVSDFGLAKVASDQYTQPMAVTSIMGT